MKRLATSLTASVFLGLPAPAVAQVSVFRGADVYRSHDLTTGDLNRRYGPLLDSIGMAVGAGDLDALGHHLGSLAGQLRASEHFAFLDFSPIQYFEGTDTTAWYLTVDVVDSMDLGRLDFDLEPTDQVEGLDTLLEEWRKFETLGFQRRAFWKPGEACPALHCLFSFQDTALAPYERTFRTGATKKLDALERMLRTDIDPEDRATAAFLLAHADDRERVKAVLLQRLHDPSSLVRNNVMRVLAFMVRDLHETDVPIDPFLPLLDGPSTTDRNKALAVVDGIIRNTPSVADHVRDRAGDTLLRLLALKQPNNHDFAYSILKRISGEDFGEDDRAAWRRWIEADHGGQTLWGRVVDDGSSTVPVSGALVQLVDRGGDVRATAIADEDGRYAIAPPGAGEYHVVVVRLGYRTTRSPLFALRAEGSVAMDITMTPAPLSLPAVTVTAEKEAEELLQPLGVTPESLGDKWIDRDEIDRMLTPGFAKDVIRRAGIAGVVVREYDDVGSGGDLCVRFVRRFPRCALNVLNGAVVSAEIAGAIVPGDLEAIAILDPLTATQFYGTQAGGGAVMMWTRRGRARPDPGGRP